MQFEPHELVHLIERHGEGTSLISLLEEMQGHYRYLPPDAMVLVSERLGLPLSQIYSVATFYHAFTLKPRGRHLVSVCLGTACHVRGSARLLDKLVKTLRVAPGETTPDRLFTLETVNCLGACALGPVMVVDGQYFGQMSPARVATVLAHVCEGGGRAP